MLSLQCFDQASTTLGNILKLINEDVFERAAILASLGVMTGPKDHVLEVDPAIQTRLILSVHRLKDRQERFGPLPELELRRVRFTVTYSVTATFVVTKKRSNQLDKAIHLSQFGHLVEQGFR